MRNCSNKTIRKIQKLDSTADVLNAISDDKSLAIFNTIALASPDSSILISKINLTRKQYYSRISSLIRSGLIRKEKREHFLTSFGKIVYNVQITIGKAINNSWKLKAIDSLEMSDNLPLEEHQKIINTIIEDKQIKEILLSKYARPPVIEVYADGSDLIAADASVENRYAKYTGN